jgi:hypothetical protein
VSCSLPRWCHTEGSVLITAADRLAFSNGSSFKILNEGEPMLHPYKASISTAMATLFLGQQEKHKWSQWKAGWHLQGVSLGLLTDFYEAVFLGANIKANTNCALLQGPSTHLFPIPPSYWLPVLFFFSPLPTIHSPLLLSQYVFVLQATTPYEVIMSLFFTALPPVLQSIPDWHCNIAVVHF